MMNTSVLLIIDVIRDSFDCDETQRLAQKRKALTEAINELTMFARANKFPIIWVRQEFEKDLRDAPLSMRETGRRVTIKGTSGVDLLPELVQQRGEGEIVKKRYSAFFGTELDERLKELQACHIIIAGVNTHACIHMSAVDAYQRDYKVILAKECIASYDDEYHEVWLRYMRNSIGKVMSNQSIIETFGSNKGMDCNT